MFRTTLRTVRNVSEGEFIGADEIAVTSICPPTREWSRVQSAAQPPLHLTRAFGAALCRSLLPSVVGSSGLVAAQTRRGQAIFSVRPRAGLKREVGQATAQAQACLRADTRRQADRPVESLFVGCIAFEGAFSSLIRFSAVRRLMRHSLAG